MFKNFIKKEAVCEIHQSQIQFLNLTSNQKKGGRALCEECDLDKPISLKKGQEILYNIEEFFQQTIQSRNAQLIQIISSEIDNLEKDIKQFIFRIKNQINEITTLYKYDPFKNYKNLQVYTTSNYHELAELIGAHYSIKENKLILTDGLEKCVQNCSKVYEKCLLEIKCIRRLLKEACDSNSSSKNINDQYVVIQILEEIQMIECHLDNTTLQEIFDLYQPFQEKQYLKCYYKDKMVENLNQTLREITSQDQFSFQHLWRDVIPITLKRCN